MRSALTACIVILLAFVCTHTSAQTMKPVKTIAVFAPVYIDSAFEGDNFKAGNSIPKNILPGLEFYNGMMLAVDSLQAEGVNIKVLFYDSKSSMESLESITKLPEFDSVSLIIASFNSRTELKPLADYSAEKKIPLISSTFPNDGGITNNPYFILLNSTLKTHCEELYKYVQRNYATGNLVMFRRKGATEDMIQSVFAEMGKSTPYLPLKIKTVELTDSFTEREFLNGLDSTKKNIVICGTPNEAFGLRMIKTISTATNFLTVTIGMPTWDGLKELSNPEYKGLEIIYSTPYNFQRTDKAGAVLMQKYKNKFDGRPSDMVFKGYESMYHFTKLLLAYDTALINHLSDKPYKVFNDFDIRPVKSRTDNRTIDYMENRKLYFIKKSESGMN